MRMIQTKNELRSVDSVISEYYDPGATITRDTPALEVWKMIEDMGNEYGITIEDCQNYILRLKHVFKFGNNTLDMDQLYKLKAAKWSDEIELCVEVRRLYGFDLTMRQAFHVAKKLEQIKLIRTFKVLVCRPATEYVSIEVAAESKEAANEIAIEKAKNETLDWELSDDTPDHIEYFTSDTEEIDVKQYAENNLYVE